MRELFLNVVTVSVSASLVAAAVLLARLLLKKAPRWIHVLLWAMVAVRLVCPVTIESEFSRMPETVSTGQYMEQWAAPESSGAATIYASASPEGTVTVTQSHKETVSSVTVLTVIWCAGMAAMALYTLISYWRLKRRVGTAVRLRANVYLSEHISSPFILGILRPKIYLPTHMEENSRPHVLAHERSHLRRGDHLWKPLGFLLLTVHWFNPILWLCYILLCRDIELACDEKVVRTLEPSQRADYSQALLNCAVSHRSISACPIAFGEVGVKERVKNVLSYKKPAFWVVLIALILCVIVAVSFLTDPVDNTALMEDVINQNGYYITGQEYQTINLVINKDSLPEECFTEEGYAFEPGAVVPYHSFCDNVLYLKHVGLNTSSFSEDYLNFTFDFTASEYNHGRLLLPYGINIQNGYIEVPATEDGVFEVWDNQQTYESAAILQKIAAEREFTVMVKRSVWEQASHHIGFALDGFNFISYQKGTAPASMAAETVPKVTMEAFYMLATEVTPNGLTIQYFPDGGFNGIDAVTELIYYLEKQVDGQWQRMEPTPLEPGLPIGKKTIRTVIDSDRDRHMLDWTTLYGTLPSGTYRIGVDYYFREEAGGKTLYAEFTIDDSMNPAHSTSTMTAEGRSCSAEFPAEGGGYTFFPEETRELIALLNQLQPEEFFSRAVINPHTVITISHSASPVQLYADGHMVQFSFAFDDTRWAVRNEALNAFIEKIYQKSPANSTYEIYNVAPLEELSSTYSLEEASIDKVVILNEGDIRDNPEVWEEFIKSANARIPASVRIMKYYSASNDQEAVKNIYDLEFDGNSYILHYAENGVLKSIPYKNLCRRSAENMPLEDDRFEEYAFWFLTNSDIIDPTQKVRENDRYAKPGDEPFMVWCDYAVRTKSLPIPENISKITLEVDLQPYITVTDPGVIDAIALIFSEAEATYTPKTHYLGPVLRFHSPDGVDLYLQLDLENDICTFNNQFYDYGKADHSILKGLWKLLDLTYWPDEILEHDAFAWYFDQRNDT